MRQNSGWSSGAIAEWSVTPARSTAPHSKESLSPSIYRTEGVPRTPLQAPLDMNREVDVEFVTRYAIPEAAVEALTWFLSDVSPRTVAAMKNFVHLPDLF